MPNPDERVITMSIAKWNVVLAALGLAQSIAGEIATQAAEQERKMALANGPLAEQLDQQSGIEN